MWLAKSGKPRSVGIFTNESSPLYVSFTVGFTLISLMIVSFLPSVGVVVAVVVAAVGIGISSLLILSLIYREFMALVSITDTVFEPILLTYNFSVIGLIAIPTGESPT